MLVLLRRRWDSVLVGLVFLLAVLGPVLAVVLDRRSGPVAADGRNGAAFIQNNLTYGTDHDLAVWVDTEGWPHAGRRDRVGGEWEVVPLGEIAGNPLAAPTDDDGHNVYAIAEGPDGRVHVIGNSHADELHYVRTAVPGRFDSWEAAVVAGPSERVTYPRFVDRGDELLFFRREGSSGNGSLELDVMDDSGTWRHVATVIDGIPTEENPYLNRIGHDPDRDLLHLVFTWRGSSDVDTTNDVGHAMSSDGGRSWTTIDGESLSLPIVHDDRTTIVDTDDEGSGLVNAGGLAIDADGNPHAVLSVDGGDQRRVLHIRHDGVAWHTQSLSSPGAGRPGLASDAAGDIWMLARAGESIVAVDVADASRSRSFSEARLPPRWEVAIDSRSMESEDRVRTLVPDDDVPRVIELWP